MSITDPRLLTWLGSPWSRECDICGVVTTDPERTARHKAWHALVDVLIAANDTGVSHRDDDDGAGKGSTATKTGHESDAEPAEAPGEGRSEIGPQKGTQSLGDGPRPPESQLGRWIRALNVAPAARDERALLAAFADDIDADYTRVATEHDALTTERDRLAADIAIMRDAGMTATDVQRRRAEKAEAERDDFREHARDWEATAATMMRERDEALAEVESLQRAAQVTDASWREHVERAEKAEAAVARVRALVGAEIQERERFLTEYGPMKSPFQMSRKEHEASRPFFKAMGENDVRDRFARTILAALAGVDAGGEA